MFVSMLVYLLEEAAAEWIEVGSTVGLKFEIGVCVDCHSFPPKFYEARVGILKISF